MSRLLVAAVAGLIFGLGLAVSEMVNPQKVIGFLDVAGNWDPNLALVMGGALVVTGGTFGFILKRSEPLFDTGFHFRPETISMPNYYSALEYLALGGASSVYAPAPQLQSWPMVKWTRSGLW
jgi:uncharacterized membrane protein YedE/YeeE